MRDRPDVPRLFQQDSGPIRAGQARRAREKRTDREGVTLRDTLRSDFVAKLSGCRTRAKFANQDGELGNGRSERIRTSGPCVPNTVLYQAELHSDT